MTDLDRDESLRFSNVSFSYGRRVEVFSGFDHTFSHGTTVVLGPNGSGKSTLFALGASAYKPRRGTVEIPGVAGARRKRHVYRANVSWLPQGQQFVPGLNAREQVAYVGWLKGLSKSDAWDRSREAIARVNLTAMDTKSPRHLSGGQQRRLALAQALVHDARLLLLDEPTAGLDPAQRKSFRETVADVLADRAVIVSTHDTQDIATVFDHVVVLISGQIKWSGLTTAFLSQAPSGTKEERQAEEAYSAIALRAGVLRE